MLEIWTISDKHSTCQTGKTIQLEEGNQSVATTIEGKETEQIQNNTNIQTHKHTNIQNNTKYKYKIIHLDKLISHKGKGWWLLSANMWRGGNVILPV
jgi:hypothetical protein